MYPASSILLTRGLSRTPTAAILLRCHQSTKSDSFLNSAAETISSLRWRIATSLTESLSKEEQQQLLTRLKVVEPQPQPNKTTTTTTEDTEEEHQKSIAEAVAQARAEESKRQTAKWEREKDRLRAELEEAATKRVENELLIQHRKLAFEKWQQEVQNSNENVEEKKSAATDATVVEEEGHPVLGKAIVDLGYKRIHTASVQALKSLPVWKKQRTYRHKRAESMAQDKMKTLHLGMPGIIALHEDKNGNLSIVDGQHRVGMLSILEEQKNNNDNMFNLDQILCEVFVESSENNNSNSNDPDEHAQEIFLEINKAEPVKLVDLPGINLTKAQRKTINEGAKRLEEAYPAMFSPSQRCRAPHLNIDNLRDALFKSEAVKRHNLKSPKAMETWLLQHNERLRDEFTKEGSVKTETVSKTALEKAIKHDFFLGLDSTWLLA